MDAEDYIRVIGDAANGRDGISEARRLQPSVIVMDIAMPELNGVDATRAILETCPDSRVLILSMYYTSEHFFLAFQAGALGYLLMESAVGGGGAAGRAGH